MYLQRLKHILDITTDAKKKTLEEEKNKNMKLHAVRYFNKQSRVHTKEDLIKQESKTKWSLKTYSMFSLYPQGSTQKHFLRGGSGKKRQVDQQERYIIMHQEHVEEKRKEQRGSRKSQRSNGCLNRAKEYFHFSFNQLY